MGKQVKIFIVDDHPIFRQGLRQVVESEPNLIIVGEAADAATALTQMLKLQPDVTVLDIDLPEMNGLKLAAAMKKARINTDIVILTSYKEESLFNGAMDEGVKGYILKENAATDLVAGLKAVAAGQIYLSPSISKFLLNRRQRRTELDNEQPLLAALTPMERRILKMIAQNKTSKEIGKELFISHRTVETHRANICEKLGLQGPHPLLQFALQHRSEL